MPLTGTEWVRKGPTFCHDLIYAGRPPLVDGYDVDWGRVRLGSGARLEPGVPGAGAG